LPPLRAERFFADIAAVLVLKRQESLPVYTM
jgi:hypothetical protein